MAEIQDTTATAPTVDELITAWRAANLASKRADAEAEVLSDEADRQAPTPPMIICFKRENESAPLRLATRAELLQHSDLGRHFTARKNLEQWERQRADALNALDRYNAEVDEIARNIGLTEAEFACHEASRAECAARKAIIDHGPATLLEAAAKAKFLRQFFTDGIEDHDSLILDALRAIERDLERLAA